MSQKVTVSNTNSVEEIPPIFASAFLGQSGDSGSVPHKLGLENLFFLRSVRKKSHRRTKSRNQKEEKKLKDGKPKIGYS